MKFTFCPHSYVQKFRFGSSGLRDSKYMFGGRKGQYTLTSVFEEKSIPHYEIFVKALVSKYLLYFSKSHEGMFLFARTPDLTLTGFSTAATLMLSLAPCVTCLQINLLDDIFTNIFMQFSVYVFINFIRNGISSRTSQIEMDFLSPAPDGS